MKTVEEYVAKCSIDFTSAQSMDDLLSRVKQLEKELKTVGYSAKDIGKGIEYAVAGSSKNYREAGTTRRNPIINGAGIKVVQEYYRRVEEERQKNLDRSRAAEYRQYRQLQVQAQRLAGISNPFAFFSQKSGIHLQQLINNISKANPKLMGLGIAFQTFKGAWDFADSIAKINTNLLHLGYTSTLGAQKLADLGSAVAAFGGSAASVASGNQKFLQQIEDLKRGGGLGYLGELAYKYGFSADLTGDWESNTKKAIAHARQMLASGDKGGAMAFLRKFDEANFTSNMMKANMSAAEVEANDAYYKSYDRVGDKKLITEETLKYNIETEKAKRAWEAITNQLAAMLLPIMTKLTAFVRWISNGIAKLPPLLGLIASVLGGIVGLMTIAIARSTYLIGKKMLQLKVEKEITLQQAMQNALSGPWGLFTAIAGIAGAIGFGAMAVTSDVGMAGEAGSTLNSPSNSLSLQEAFGGKLTARERYRLDLQQENISNSEKANTQMNNLAESAVTLVDVFNRIEAAGNKMQETLGEYAKTAMSMEQAEHLATIASNVNNANNIANTNNANVNVNIEQVFNEADTSEIRAGNYAAGSEVVKMLSQAGRRFNT